MTDFNRSDFELYQRELTWTLELSSALCDMLFAFTCFEEKGLKEFPEDLQVRLLAMREKAQKAFIKG